MKHFFYVFLILCSVFLISCEENYSIADPSDFPKDFNLKEDPYKPEINLPKEIKISGEYTFTKKNKSFQFNSEAQDWYCYKIENYINPSDEDLVSIRFRLYDKNNKLLHERLPFTNEVGREFIEFNEKYPQMDTFRVWTYIPYHKEGVKIKAILVDDEGKHLKVLDEREIATPEEFRKRVFYGDCYREVGFGYDIEIGWNLLK